ncbi:odorant receptor 131-1 [Danio rerio]|uniref:Odorant receptor n=1 Tax=Danio rerio TaxID=7955 RepID=Q2PRB2_DANRE|nr:odorant receptor 131-1 [Danio rerio]ABC43355.1 odorant receptor [Danio rerio]|eukprot:NP_001122051.1 odorant receptor, family H, subfamily 131, member 1 [Danio rerio]
MNSTSNSSLSNTFIMKSLKEKALLVQVLVGILLYVNGLMIFTFLKKETFRDTRYILFAQTLFVDSSFMIFADLTLLCSAYQLIIHNISCYVFCTVMSVLSICSPVTLVAMCLERYVAICLPLRHASISSPKNIINGLLIVWGVSSVIPLFVFIGSFAYTPPNAMNSYVVCSIEVMLQVKWLADTRATSQQLLFVIMLCIVGSTYIKIMIAARSASATNKKSTYKGLRTVILHGIQLILGMMQFITPYTEMSLWKIDVMLFLNVRYSNFILFWILPRSLSPLVYGLRDKKFYYALKYYAFCGVFVVSKHKVRDIKISRRKRC